MANPSVSWDLVPDPVAVNATTGTEALNGVDLELDSDGDLVVDSDLHLTVGIAATAQSLMIRLQTFKEEWFLDLDHGVPYFQDLLGSKFNELRARAIFRGQILGSTGVTALPTLTVEFDGATRELSVDFEALTEDGSIEGSL